VVLLLSLHDAVLNTTRSPLAQRICDVRNSVANNVTLGEPRMFMWVVFGTIANRLAAQSDVAIRARKNLIDSRLLVAVRQGAQDHDAADLADVGRLHSQSRTIGEEW
jgi:hypothetical protein